MMIKMMPLCDKLQNQGKKIELFCLNKNMSLKATKSMIYSLNRTVKMTIKYIRKYKIRHKNLSNNYTSLKQIMDISSPQRVNKSII